MKNKNIWLGIILIVLIIFILVISKFPSHKSDRTETLKIGVILPLSGDLASLGEEIQRGSILAEDEVRSANEKIEVVYEDDSFDPQKTVSATNKLASNDKVDVILLAFFDRVKPILPIINASHTPLIVLWDDNDFIKQAGPYVFSNGFSTEKAGQEMAYYAYNDLHLKNIAIVSHIDSWADVIAESFKIRFENLGGKVAYEESLSPDTSDYRSSIAKIIQANPEGVYFPMVPPQSARFIIEAKQLGLKSILLSGDALTQDVIKEAGTSAEGIYFTNIFTDEGAELKQKYLEKYREEPADLTLVSFGYDGIMKSVEAKKHNDDLQAGLESIFGKLHSADRLEKIYQIHNGTTLEVSH